MGTFDYDDLERLDKARCESICLWLPMREVLDDRYNEILGEAFKYALDKKWGQAMWTLVSAVERWGWLKGHGEGHRVGWHRGYGAARLHDIEKQFHGDPAGYDVADVDPWIVDGRDPLPGEV